MALLLATSQVLKLKMPNSLYEHREGGGGGGGAYLSDYSVGIQMRRHWVRSSGGSGWGLVFYVPPRQVLSRRVCAWPLLLCGAHVKHPISICRKWVCLQPVVWIPESTAHWEEKPGWRSTMAARFPKGNQLEFPVHCIGTTKWSYVMLCLTQSSLM